MAEDYDPDKARAGFERDVLEAIVFAILWRQPDVTLRGVARDLRDWAAKYEARAQQVQTDPARDEAAVWYAMAEHVEGMADDIIAERASGDPDITYPSPC
mgnify:CR=1 FL=1